MKLKPRKKVETVSPQVPIEKKTEANKTIEEPKPDTAYLKQEVPEMRGADLSKIQIADPPVTPKMGDLPVRPEMKGMKDDKELETLDNEPNGSLMNQ